MQPGDLIKYGIEVAVLLFSAYNAVNSWKMKAFLAELKDELKEWTDEHFMRRKEMTVYEHRLDRLEEKPSNRIMREQVN